MKRIAFCSLVAISAGTPVDAQELKMGVGTWADIDQPFANTGVRIIQGSDEWALESGADGFTEFVRVAPKTLTAVRLDPTPLAGVASTLGMQFEVTTPDTDPAADSTHWSRVFFQPILYPATFDDGATTYPTPYHDRWQFAGSADADYSFDAGVAILLNPHDVAGYFGYSYLPSPSANLGLVVRVQNDVALGPAGTNLILYIDGHDFPGGTPKVGAAHVAHPYGIGGGDLTLPHDSLGMTIEAEWPGHVGVHISGTLQAGDNVLLFSRDEIAAGPSSPPISVTPVPGPMIETAEQDCTPCPALPTGGSCTNTFGKPSSKHCPDNVIVWTYESYKSIPGGPKVCGGEGASSSVTNVWERGGSRSTGSESVYFSGLYSITNTRTGFFSWRHEQTNRFTFPAGDGCGTCFRTWEQEYVKETRIRRWEDTSFWWFTDRDCEPRDDSVFCYDIAGYSSNSCTRLCNGEDDPGCPGGTGD